MNQVASILNPAEINCLRAIMAVGSARASVLVSFHKEIFEKETPGGLSKKELRKLDASVQLMEREFPQLAEGVKKPKALPGRKADANGTCTQVHDLVLSLIKSGTNKASAINQTVYEKFPSYSKSTLYNYTYTIPNVKREYGTWSIISQ